MDKGRVKGLPPTCGFSIENQMFLTLFWKNGNQTWKFHVESVVSYEHKKTKSLSSPCLTVVNQVLLGSHQSRL